MTHDPLCHEWFGPRPAGGIYCVCELIAKARADERAATVKRVEALHIDGAVWLLRHEVIAAIKGEQP